MDELTMDYKIAFQTLTKKVIPENPDIIAVALKEVVSAEGSEIYRDVPKLAALLTQKGIIDSLVKQVELVLYGSSLVRYLDQLSKGLSPIDINNIILTAENAGLSSKAARKVVSDILYSLNVPQIAQDIPMSAGTSDLDIGTVYIPPQAYTEQLNSISAQIEKGEELDQSQFTELNAFVYAGVPAAHTLMGKLYLEGLGVTKDEEKAVKHLEYAAARGDAAAYGLLADYYYDKNNGMAYRLYSCPGALALSEKRWNRFRNLKKAKSFYNLQLALLIAGLVLVEAFMFIFMSSAVTGSHFAAAIVCTVLNCIAMAGILFVHIKNPYQDLRNFSIPFLAVFLIYVLILI